jgi:AcrR family transcriptional regulator
VDDIAEAAGVSPRTYNNYFASREQAIVAAVVADRGTRIARAVASHPGDGNLAEAVIEAVVTQYADASSPRSQSPTRRHPGRSGDGSPAARPGGHSSGSPERHPEAGYRPALPLEVTVDIMLMITSNPALRDCYVGTVASIEGPLAEAIVERCRGIDPLTAEVLATSVGAAARVALRQWLQPSGVPGLVVVSGSLPDLLRNALTTLAPALEAAG